MRMARTVVRAALIPVRTVRIAVRTVLTAIRTVQNAIRTVLIAIRTVLFAVEAVHIALKMAFIAGGAVHIALRQAVDGLDGGPLESVCSQQEDTMTRKEYEERRRALEAQLQADVALIQAAHETRIRSLDRLWQVAAEGEGDLAVPAASGNGALPAAAVRPAVSAASAPGAPARRKMRERGEVLSALEEALPQLPEVFDKRDIARILGWEPAHATLYRALRQLVDEQAIVMESYSLSGTTNAFRKLPRP